jgi:hypothetical protein
MFWAVYGCISVGDLALRLEPWAFQNFERNGTQPLAFGRQVRSHLRERERWPSISNWKL